MLAAVHGRVLPSQAVSNVVIGETGARTNVTPMTADDLRKYAHQLEIRLDEHWEMAASAPRNVSAPYVAEMLGQIRAYRVTLDMLWHVTGHAYGRQIDPCDARMAELRTRVGLDVEGHHDDRPGAG